LREKHAALDESACPPGIDQHIRFLAIHVLSPEHRVRAPRPAVHPAASTQGEPMLWTVFVILLVLWLLGLVTSYTMGGFIHILLVVAIAVLLIQLISGRRAV
jgi:hypothetical protein